ncbi:MAG: catalase HPII, partial [Bauldia litoralis]
TWIEAKQKIDGGPSVLYDAVAILASADQVDLLAKMPPAKDFVSDAFAHCKFIAYSATAMPLLEKAGIADDLDGGCIEVAASGDMAGFVKQCRDVRFWEREASLKPV